MSLARILVALAVIGATLTYAALGSIELAAAVMTLGTTVWYLLRWVWSGEGGRRASYSYYAAPRGLSSYRRARRWEHFWKAAQWTATAGVGGAAAAVPLSNVSGVSTLTLALITAAIAVIVGCLTGLLLEMQYGGRIRGRIWVAATTALLVVMIAFPVAEAV